MRSEGVEDGVSVVEKNPGRVELADAACIEDEYPRVVEDGGDAMGDGEDGASGEVGPDRSLDEGVRLHVHR